MGIMPKRGDCFFEAISMRSDGNIVTGRYGLVDELRINYAL